MSGTLYVVATPIGNLQDMSPRALEVLRTVALIAAEDTRHSARLLQHFGVSTPTTACHDHNERDKSIRLVERMLAGEDMALISDAGTPLISDPGYHLVRQAREAGVRVCPIPGACALIAALSAAGLPSDRFAFEGFCRPRRTVGACVCRRWPLNHAHGCFMKRRTACLNAWRTCLIFSAPSVRSYWRGN